MKKFVIAAMIIMIMLFAIAFTLEAAEVPADIGKTEAAQIENAPKTEKYFSQETNNLFLFVIFSDDRLENLNQKSKNYTVIVINSLPITDKTICLFRSGGSAKNKFII